MRSSKAYSDFDSHSTEELREIFCQLLPSLEKLVLVAREFCGQNTAASIPQLCESCDERESCSEPCEKLNSVLPKINSGKNNREKKTDYYPTTHREIEKIRLTDLFEQYQSCKEIFTNKQWVLAPG